MSILELRKQYFDEDWLRFMTWCESEYSKAPESAKNLLKDIEMPKNIRIALIVKLGAHSNTWLFDEIPILENKKPIDFLHSAFDCEVIKSAIMSMPD